LHLTQTLYDNYTSLLGTSAQLVKAIERADWYDRLLIFAAFALFLLTVGWVIKRRVLDKVLGGVGWWFGGSWKLVRMGLGRSTSTAVAPTALAAAGATGVKAVSALHGTQASSDRAAPNVKWTGDIDSARIPVPVESAVMTTNAPSADKAETIRDEL
jgi:protein transport protein SEC20